MMKRGIQNEKGAVLILFAICLFVFIGVAALAIDIGHLYMVRNELQNAADAGALAGAANLYKTDSVTGNATVNPESNKVAFDASTINRATAKYAEAGSYYRPVDVDISMDEDEEYYLNDGDIQRGHWSFGTGEFTENSSLAALTQEDLYNATFEELDNPNSGLVNAMKVTVRRQANPASSFFARIFGFDEFLLSATAVGYLGFANTINPGEVDMPMAICRETIENNFGELECNFSRLINSSDKDDANTAGWTNYTQDTEHWPEGCKNPVPNELADIGGTPGLICNVNPKPIVIGADMAVNGGQMESAFSQFRDCWDDHIEENGYVPMKKTMMVVQCSGLSNPNGCLPTYPPVRVDIIWVTPKNLSGNVDKKYDEAPFEMLKPDGEIWTNDDPNGYERWKDFVETFELKNPNGDYAFEDYYSKTIYAMPNCEEVIPKGTTGGKYTGILAKIPVIVQ